jgi:hypothetical protein
MLNNKLPGRALFPAAGSRYAGARQLAILIGLQRKVGFSPDMPGCFSQLTSKPSNYTGCPPKKEKRPYKHERAAGLLEMAREVCLRTKVYELGIQISGFRFDLNTANLKPKT